MVDNPRPGNQQARTEQSGLEKFKEKQRARVERSIEKYGEASVEFKGSIAEEHKLGAYAETPKPYKGVVPTPELEAAGLTRDERGKFLFRGRGISSSEWNKIKTHLEEGTRPSKEWLKAVGIKSIRPTPKIDPMLKGAVVVSGYDPKDRSKVLGALRQDVALQSGLVREGGRLKGTPEQLAKYQEQLRLQRKQEQVEAGRVPSPTVSGVKVTYPELAQAKAIAYEQAPTSTLKVQKKEPEMINVMSGYKESQRKKVLKQMRGQTLAQKYERVEGKIKEKVIKPVEDYLRDKGITEQQLTQGILTSQYTIPGTGLVTATVPFFRKEQKLYIEEQIRGVRQEPLKTGLLFGVSFALPMVGRGVKTIGTATKITENLPGVSKVIPKLTKLAGAGLLGWWGYETGKEVIATPTTEGKKRVIYRTIGTEIIPIMAGAKLGEVVGSKTIGFFRTIGREEIPLEQISSLPISVTVAKRTPTPKQLKTAFEKKTLIPKPTKGKTVPKSAGLPTEQAGESWAWHGTPETFPKKTVTQPGTSELPGLYISPQFEAYFLKVGTDQSYKFGLGFPVAGTPTGVRIQVKSFDAIPKSVKVKGRDAMKQFMMSEAEKGRAYIPTIKGEYEAIIPPETSIERIAGKYYVRVKGVRVPLDQYAVEGITPQISSTQLNQIKNLIKTGQADKKTIASLTGLSESSIEKTAGKYYVKIDGKRISLDKYFSREKNILTGQAKTIKELNVLSESYAPSSLVSPYILTPTFISSSKSKSSSYISPTSKMSSIKPSEPYSYKPSEGLKTSKISLAPSTSTSYKPSTTIGSSSITRPSKTYYPGKPSYPYYPEKPSRPSYPSKSYKRTPPPSSPLKSAIEKLKKSETLTKGFETWVKREGEYRKLKGVLPKSEAIKRGKRWAETTLGASFKIRPTKAMVKGIDRPFEVGRRFRDYKIRKGKKIPIFDEWIQKRSYRLSTRPEVSEIQRAKKKAPKKKKRKRWGWF